MDNLGDLVVIVPGRRAGDPGSNPRPGENVSLKLLTSTCQMVILKAKILYIYSTLVRLVTVLKFVKLTPTTQAGKYQFTKLALVLRS